jgi:protein SCO1/2
MKLAGKLSLIIGLSLVVSIAYVYMNRTQSQRPKTAASLLAAPRPIEPFALKTAQGEPFSNSDFTGKWTLLAFGFTSCPDICPATMAYFKQELSALEPSQRSDVQFVMISVDPEKDTPEVLQSYGAAFDKRITMLTGSLPELKQVAALLGAYFEKEFIDTGKLDAVKDPSSYTMAHSPHVFMVNPKGELTGFYQLPQIKGQIANDISALKRSF